MKIKKRQLFFGVSLFLVVLISYLALKPYLGLSITEVSCSGDKVWLKYSLEDEGSRLRSLISDCNSNPSGGWVGEIYFDAVTTTGNTYRMGGYTASKDSVQKINCGISTQTGKTFVGTLIPNEGIGTYDVKASGKYYLASENYAVAHNFNWRESKSIACILPSSTCEDGTPIRSCSSKYLGKWCGADAGLYDRAGTCGCPEGMETSGNFCVIPEVEEDEPIENTPIVYTPEVDSPEAPPSQSGTVAPTTPSTITFAPSQDTVFGFERNTAIIALSVILLGWTGFAKFGGWI